MVEIRPAEGAPGGDNTRVDPVILTSAALASLVWVGLALAGDLRGQPGLLLPAVAALAAVGLVAWHRVRRRPAALAAALAAAALFRLILVLAPPSLSDDVYRYVWDGRVWLHGVHPYAHAPADPALAPLRDDGWAHINHPEVRTIYPPGAQVWFLLLAALGAGTTGFKLAAAAADLAVVAALAWLLGRTGRPRDRLVLYAWHPLAVLETAGNGHVEPLGVALVLAATAWLVGGRPLRATLALAAAVHVKLLPLVLVPGHVRRAGAAAGLLLAVALVVPFALFALGGPPMGAGLAAFAGRWEYNATLYAATEAALRWVDSESWLRPAVSALEGWTGGRWLPFEAMHRHVWPRSVARGAVAVAALAWLGWLAWRRRAEPVRESLWATGGVLLLAPVFHPWYGLWALGWAAACRSWSWLLLAALLPLAYASPAGGGVPPLVQLAIFGPPLLLWAGSRLAAHLGYSLPSPP